jgi:hypothetical protein
MTLNEAKAVIYGNVVYACEKAGYPPNVVQLVQDACDTVIALADKTEPQTCEECEHWSDTEDGCADRHGCKTTEDLQDWKDRMWAEAIVTEQTTEDSSTVPTSSKMEQVDKTEPQTEMPRCSVNGTPFDECGFCEYFNCDTCKCEADVPQTERSKE